MPDTGGSSTTGWPSERTSEAAGPAHASSQSPQLRDPSQCWQHHNDVWLPCTSSWWCLVGKETREITQEEFHTDQPAA